MPGVREEARLSGPPWLSFDHSAGQVERGYRLGLFAARLLDHAAIEPYGDTVAGQV